jgi:hypothetical protein
MFPHWRSLSHWKCLGGDSRTISHTCYYAGVCANASANDESYYACDNDRDDDDADDDDDDDDDADTDDDNDDGDDDEDALLFFVFAGGANWDTVLRQRQKHAWKRGETSCELTVQVKVIHRTRYYEIQDGKGNIRLYDRKLKWINCTEKENLRTERSL